MSVLTLPRRVFEELLQTLVAPGVVRANMGVGLRRHAGRFAWLARRGQPGPEHRFFEIRTGEPPADLAAATPAEADGILWLGRGAGRGRWRGATRVGDRFEPIDELRLVGPGMYRIRAAKPLGDTAIARGGGSRSQSAAERWSRTIGALGGFDAWSRLAGLSVTIVGCGRTGSMLAEALGRLGLDRLTLIDPDLIEPGNLGEMALVTGRDRGRPKAEAVGERLARVRRFRAGRPRWLAVGLEHPSAIAAARACDVLACCVDDDAARLRAGLIACLDHKVLLDIGVAILPGGADVGHAGPPARVAGSDVRLVLPGDGCLLCRGGLRREVRAFDDLIRDRDAARTIQHPDQWRRQRAGSLASLNQLAVAVAVQMLQDLVAERIRSTTWAQLVIDDAGRLAVNHLRTETQRLGCNLCLHAGLGDDPETSAGA